MANKMYYAKWIEEDQRFAFSIDDNGGFEIERDSWLTLLDGQSSGKVIFKGSDGLPGLSDPSASLEYVKSAKILSIDSSCAASIVGGFTSEALGAPYTYPSKDADQANLSSSVLASLMPGNAKDWTTPFWCADADGAWTYREHTALQIQAVGVAAKEFVSSCIARKITIEAAITAATDIEVVQAIAW